jgi:hypothetical protein
MRPYLAWLVAAAAALAASIPTAGVSAAFVAGRGPSMGFHPRALSSQRPAPRPQMTPMADTYGYGYGYGDPGYDLPVRAYIVSSPSYFGPSCSGPAYPVYSYRVAPSAKIIHLTPRE